MPLRRSDNRRMLAKVSAAAALTAAIAIAGCGDAGPPPVAGTWGMSAELERKLDSRLHKRRASKPLLDRRVDRRRAERERIDRRLQATYVSRQANLAAARSDRCGLIDLLTELFTLGFASTGCGSRAPELTARADIDSDRARELYAQAKRARRRVRAAQRAVRHERRLAVRTTAKARAARLIGASDVSCRQRDGRVHARLRLHNNAGSDVEAFVRVTYSVRVNGGRVVRGTTKRDTRVEIGRGEEREIDIDAGSPARADGRASIILTCAPRLADVRLPAPPRAPARER